ncbi:MAG: hypothetical protein H0V00_09450 [Chloroflexia bacterium]|nr:hypothetical protein [Chloroflexia bacterium]
MRHIKTHEPAPTRGAPAKDDAEQVMDLGQGGSPRTELGWLLLAARREFVAAEGQFLDRDELGRELAERRGGASAAGER